MIFELAPPYDSYWRGPFRGYGVRYRRVRRSMGGRLVAVFRGKFARLRAEHRANLLSRAWRAAHAPKSWQVPRVGSSAVIPREVAG